MNAFKNVGALSLVFLTLGFTVGCKKNSDNADTKVEEQAIETALEEPGAVEVMAAIEKKDYDGAMQALLKIRAGVTTREQNLQYMVIANEAKQKLIEASATDPKAAQALTVLRGMTLGR